MSALAFTQLFFRDFSRSFRTFSTLSTSTSLALSLASLRPSSGHRTSTIATALRLAINPYLRPLSMQPPSLSATIFYCRFPLPPLPFGPFLCTSEPPSARATTLIASPCQDLPFETIPNFRRGRNRRWWLHLPQRYFFTFQLFFGQFLAGHCQPSPQMASPYQGQTFETTIDPCRGRDRRRQCCHTQRWFCSLPDDVLADWQPSSIGDHLSQHRTVVLCRSR